MPLRTNVEFAKRVFLDRLTTVDQALSQPNDINMINEGPGDPYIYGGCWDPFNFGIGADCSGCVGIMTAAVFHGTKMGWQRYFSTETFPNGFDGFRQTSQDDLLNGNYCMKVCICHGGGGPNSHMNCSVDGWVMESNGDYGTCTANHGAIPQSSDYWNDFWVLPSPIIEDTTWRQPMGYPLGVDYAGGRIAGADLRKAGVAFVCRYLTDGGPGLPGKQLMPDEFTDLQTNGINVVFNYETTANFMMTDSGATDAQKALAYIRSLPGMASANPVIYFSCDFDEAPNQQATINQFLTDAGTVLGGPSKVGIYGAYYVCQRALDAGVCKYMWQTEAWSGGNIDSRVNIMQRNGLGYLTIDGVQCDQNQAHTNDYGQWAYAPAPSPLPTPVPVPAPPAPAPTPPPAPPVVVTPAPAPPTTPPTPPVPGSAATLGQMASAIYWKETTPLTLAHRPLPITQADDQYGHTLSARAEGLVTQALIADLAKRLGTNVETVTASVLASLTPVASK
jgi:hypothetical protein